MLRAFRELARDNLQRVLREVLEEHDAEQRQWSFERHAAMTDELSAVREEIVTLRSELVALEVRARRDLSYAGEVTAARDSAALVAEQMPSALMFPRPEETLQHAASLVGVPGSVLEFGVAAGYTLDLLVQALPGRTAAGFDVFTGLPEDWRSGFPAGMFAQDVLPEVPGAELVVGLFEDTLPGYLARETENVALLHLDADLYTSTRTVLELVGPRLVEGSVVLFDEYFNYPGWREGEFLAWQQYAGKTGTTFRYTGYTYNHEQVSMVITGVDR